MSPLLAANIIPVVLAVDLPTLAQTAFFVLLAGLAVGSAVSLVVQRNPLYSAISLVGVFMALAGLYLLLAAPFIAAVQVIVYAGAIMVLVVFVIMLLNVEEEEHRAARLRYLIPTAVVLAAVLFGEAAFVLYFVQDAGVAAIDPTAAGANAAPSNVGLTHSIGQGLFTTYLLPFEVTSILILMALVGAITLARRTAADARREPGPAGALRPVTPPHQTTAYDVAEMPGATAPVHTGGGD